MRNPKPKPKRVVVKVISDEDRVANWREAAELDPRLSSYTGGRLSAFCRLELDAAAARVLAPSQE